MGAVLFILLLLVLVCCAFTEEVLDTGSVGRIVLWSPSANIKINNDVEHSIQYDTATIETNELSRFLNSHVSSLSGQGFKKENNNKNSNNVIVVLLNSLKGQAAPLEYKSIQESIRKSNWAVAATSLYKSAVSSSASSSSSLDVLRSTATAKTIDKSLAMDQLTDFIESHASASSDMEKDIMTIVQVDVSNTQTDMVIFDKIHTMLSDKAAISMSNANANTKTNANNQGRSSAVVFVTVVQPTALVPTEKAQYSIVQDMTNKRELGSSSSSSITQGSVVTGFSIYHGGSYLYLTPNLVTGLMTGLFFTAVIIFFLGLMNEIQGPSSFTDEKGIPPIGKEA